MWDSFWGFSHLFFCYSTTVWFNYLVVFIWKSTLIEIMNFHFSLCNFIQSFVGCIFFLVSFFLFSGLSYGSSPSLYLELASVIYPLSSFEYILLPIKKKKQNMFSFRAVDFVTQTCITTHKIVNEWHVPSQFADGHITNILFFFCWCFEFF